MSAPCVYSLHSNSGSPAAPNYIAKLNAKHTNMDNVKNLIDNLTQMGYSITENPDNKSFSFIHKGNTITVWPKKEWFSGKGITDGRGLDKLLQQLKKDEKLSPDEMKRRREEWIEKHRRPIQKQSSKTITRNGTFAVNEEPF